MNTAVQIRVTGLEAAAKALDTARAVVTNILYLGAVVLFIFGFFSDSWLLIFGGAIALVVQAWLVGTLISAFVSKLYLDVELARTKI